MKIRRKFISLVTVLAIFCSLTCNAFAVQTPQSEIRPRSNIEREAPNGGTYTDLKNPNFPTLDWLKIVSCTYIPAKPVLDWAVGSTAGAVSSILGWGAAGYGADWIAKQVLLQFAIEIPSWWIATLLTAGQLASYIHFQLDKDAALNALAKTPDGIYVRIVVDTLGGPIQKFYDPWYNYPYVPLYPNGGTASWHPGDYEGLV